MKFRNILNNSYEYDKNEPIIEFYSCLKENIKYSQKLSSIGSWTYDINQDSLFWTDGVYAILECDAGILSEDITKFYEFIHPEDLEKVKTAFSRAKKGIEYELGFRIITTNKTTKFINEKVMVLINNEGAPIKLIGVIQDIKDLPTRYYSSETEEAEEIDKNKHFFTQMQKLASIGFWERNLSTNINYWSNETYNIFGVDVGNFEHSLESFLNLVHPEDRANVSNLVKAPQIEPFDMEFRIIRPSGEIRNVHQVVEFLYSQNGDPIHICGTIKDITEKRGFQEKIKLKDLELNNVQEKYEMLINHSSDIFCIISKNGTIEYLNRAFENIIGYTSRECIGKSIFSCFSKSEGELLQKLIDIVKSNSGKKVSKDISLTTKYGKLRFLEIRIQSLISQDAAKGIVINLRDITQRYKSEDRIKHISTHDGQTGLPNARFLRKRIRELCSQKDFIKGRFALFMVSISEVKDIGENLGSKVANKLLAQIVNRISSQLGENDTFARYSEGKLAIITQGFISDYENLAKELVSIFSNLYNVDSYELNISTNIGITIYPKDLNEEHSVIECSNIAMLQARQEGNNKYSFFSSDIDIYHYRKFMLRHDLRNAIKNNQLAIYYQPVVNLKNYKMIAAEASVFWSHPEWGTIESEEFLWIAKEIGFMENIESWVLDQVCINYKDWQKNKNIDIKVIVEIFSKQFYNKKFLDIIMERMNYYGIDPGFGIIKVDESFLFENPEKINSIISSFRETGLKVAIGSSGTLQCMTQFDADIMTIDKSFLRKGIFEDKSKIVLENFIKLVRDLDMKLLLEGVESWDYINLLSSLNSIAVKGALFSDPICLKDFEILLSKRICKPSILKAFPSNQREERRRYYRINFSQFLESEMSILRIRDKKIQVGTSLVLIKNIGAGGLCFISDIKFPVEKSIVLQFKTELISSEVKVYGNIVWTEETEKGLFIYGLEFTIDESDRDKLLSVLNQVQVKMKNDLLFADGKFISKSAPHYFRKSN